MKKKVYVRAKDDIPGHKIVKGDVLVLEWGYEHTLFVKTRTGGTAAVPTEAFERVMDDEQESHQ